MARVGSTLDRIIKQYAGKTIVLVTHGGFIDGAFIYFMGLNSFSMPRVGFHTHNTSLTHWRYLVKEGRTSRWWLESYNDTTHARALMNKAGTYTQDNPSVPVPTEENSDTHA